MRPANASLRCDDGCNTDNIKSCMVKCNNENNTDATGTSIDHVKHVLLNMSLNSCHHSMFPNGNKEATLNISLHMG